MKLSKEGWQRMSDDIQRQATAMNAKADRLEYNIETAVKNGVAETVIQQLTELESTIRVLKRRLYIEMNPSSIAKYWSIEVANRSDGPAVELKDEPFDPIR